LENHAKNELWSDIWNEKSFCGGLEKLAFRFDENYRKIKKNLVQEDLVRNSIHSLKRIIERNSEKRLHKAA
jgi:hypothetical protein